MSGVELTVLAADRTGYSRPPMEVAVPAALERVITRYRRDVHGLNGPATDDAIAAVETHLDRRIPSGLRELLRVHNGGSLFRGALRIRGTSELSGVSHELPDVVVFADGLGDIRWVWADLGPDRVVFGRWSGTDVEPLHTSFLGWFTASLAEIESRSVSPEDADAIRLAADPEDAIQLTRAARRDLSAGRPEAAEQKLLIATRLDPAMASAWQTLGDALVVSDRGAARRAWTLALQLTVLPLPWPGAPCADAHLIRSLSGAGANPEDVEPLFANFIDSRVGDVRTAHESALAAAAAQALARSLSRRGRRSDARATLARILGRFEAWPLRDALVDLWLDLAQLEAGLGRTDEAEAALRRVRREGSKSARGRAVLAIAGFAVAREEPWADEILDEALEAGLDEADHVRALLLRTERAIRQDRLADAVQHVAAARVLARRVGIGILDAHVDLVEADVLRQQGQIGSARALLERGLHKADERDRADAGNRQDIRIVTRAPDAELYYRLQTRLGDVALDAADFAEAERRFRGAVAGFAAHELPAREGWALLRLVRTLGDTDEAGLLLAFARNRFQTADHPVGLAAVDTISGSPDASLDWHLQRATAHAGARHDAQRARPPWERADADRPERRLGAHRLAIAASHERVVDGLSSALREGVQQSAHGRSRASDPQMLRYAAAVDLLAGCPSWRAANLLLQHLIEQTTDGVAASALHAAIARSPNAALTDGLLQSVERPQGVPPVAVAVAAELLGLRRESAAVRPLVALVGSRYSPPIRQAAVVALGRIGDRAAVDPIALALPDPNLTEAAGVALLLLGDRRGIDFHARAMSEGRFEGAGVHPGEIVGRFGGPEYLPLLKMVAALGDDRSAGALHGLGLMGDPRGVETLLDSLESRDRNVVSVANSALQLLTGHADDTDEPGYRNRWRAWWRSNADRMSPGIRHRGGVVFDLGTVIEKLEDDDGWVRRGAYDELVITTGQSIPFDADGPWRLQRAHVRAWRDWFHRNRSRFSPGRWFLDGKAIH